MKVSNRVTIELTVDEAIELAKILECNIYESQSLEHRLKEEICKELDINSWELCYLNKRHKGPTIGPFSLLY
jgi:hypothetical protein